MRGLSDRLPAHPPFPDIDRTGHPMSATAAVTRPIESGRGSLLFGGWEVGLLVIMALLYLGGLYLNPAYFGSTGALFSVLRDASRYGVMAVGMTFVIVNRELDLSVGSTFGLTAAIFGMVFAPAYFDLGVWTAVFWCLVLGLAVGLINGFLVTILEVPAFIATLTMLFIGRGVILGLTGGKNIAFELKADENAGFFRSATSTRSASTIKSSYSWSSRRSGPSRSPIRRSAGRPMRAAATSRPPAMPASTPALSACAPTSSPRSAR